VPERWSELAHSIDTPDTPDTSYSINFLHAFFINTTNSLHTMCRINPSDTPHNTGSLHSFDTTYSPYSINISRTKYMRSDATKLSSADYKDIMQYQDMKSKPLDQLRKRFHVSTSRLYQIWRGQE
ncbi:8496_t:CDS:2, partial [Funneliformis geosporum]